MRGSSAGVKDEWLNVKHQSSRKRGMLAGPARLHPHDLPQRLQVRNKNPVDMGRRKILEMSFLLNACRLPRCGRQFC